MRLMVNVVVNAVIQQESLHTDKGWYGVGG